MSSRRLPLALLLYTALLVFGSLYPFQGFRAVETADFAFLLAPLPPFVTRTDLTTNVLVYVPFGFLLARQLSRARRLRLALPWTLVLGALFSTAMEVGQLFVPGRVASNLDIATNAVGAGLGGVLYGLARKSRWPGRGLLLLRERWLAPGRLPELGLLLLALWFLTQLSLEAPSLIAGHLRTGFVPLWEIPGAPEQLEPWLAAIYALELTVLGMLLATLPHRAPGPWAATMFATVTLLLGKFFAAALFLKWTVLPRLVSLELVAGVAAGMLSLFRLARAPASRARGVAAGFAAGLGAALAFGAWLEGLAGLSARHFNITGIAAGLALLWPWLAAGYLAASAWRAGRGGPSAPAHE